MLVEFGGRHAAAKVDSGFLEVLVEVLRYENQIVRARFQLKMGRALVLALSPVCESDVALGTNDVSHPATQVLVEIMRRIPIDAGPVPGVKEPGDRGVEPSL
jgi:hypothetical protein